MMFKPAQPLEIPGEKPHFFRIRAAQYYACPWVADVKKGVSISLSVSKKSAKIFPAPVQEFLDYIKFAIGEYTLEPATFAEWIEQDPTWVKSAQ